MASSRRPNRPVDLIDSGTGAAGSLLDRLLHTTRSGAPERSYSSEACCSLPATRQGRPVGPISDFREALIAYSEKKWVNGMTLHYYFYDEAPLKGDPVDVQMVRQAFAAWKGLGLGLNIVETRDIGQAELRIAFQQGNGCWSHVGTDALNVPAPTAPTMNFGRSLRHDPRGLDTPLHQIGHALGFPHEHQNPFACVAWDEDEVAAQLSGAPAEWTRDRYGITILNKHPRNAEGGAGWDPDSIMHYSFESGMILHPVDCRDGMARPPAFSESDRSEALKFYPPVDPADHPRLQTCRCAPLDIAPTGQKTLRLTPEETRLYSIRTIGPADTLAVLFRQEGDRERRIAASKEAGTGRSARIDVQLERGATYLLRIRMLSRYGTGAAAVLCR